MFVGGNPILRIDGTVVTPNWLNSLQEEAAFLVESEGLTLDPLDRTQVYQALELLIRRLTGSALAFTAGADLTAGDPLLLEDAFGVVQADVRTGNAGILLLRGTFVLPKATGATWSRGEVLFWDDGAGEITTVAGGNVSAGIAASDELSGATSGSVLLSGPPSV